MPWLLSVLLALSVCTIAKAQPREVPDYDGRGDDPTTAGEVVLWVPRLVLAPVYLVSEFVLRRPIGWVISELEEKEIAIWKVFEFGDRDQIAIVPTALIDLGFNPSVGVYARYNHFLAEHNKLRLHFTVGNDWLQLAVADRIESSDGKTRLQLRGELSRADGVYYGEGEDSLKRNQSRYAFRSLESEITFDKESWRSSSFHAFWRVRDMRLDEAGSCCDDPSLAKRVMDGTLQARTGEALALPNGFPGYTAISQGARFVVSDRAERLRSGSGVQLRLGTEYAFAADDPLRRRWLRLDAAPAVFIDLTDDNRLLHFSLRVEAISPLQGDVPFTELVDLGGTGPLKGFVKGWVIGHTAAAASLEYDWPIWMWLDGTIHAALGSAFGRDFEGFDLEAGRFSTGIGVSTVNERDHAFVFLIALGTAPLRDGGGVDSVRFVLGGSRVF